MAMGIFGELKLTTKDGPTQGPSFVVSLSYLCLLDITSFSVELFWLPVFSLL